MTPTQPAEAGSVKRYNSMGFADDLGLYVRWADHDAVVAELLKYVRHSSGCGIYRGSSWRDCDCGLANVERVVTKDSP